MPRRNYGLLHPLRRVEVEIVKTSHRKPCCQCEKRPEVKRLLVREGSGRASRQLVYCRECGDLFLKGLEDDIDRARWSLSLDESFGEPVRENH